MPKESNGFPANETLQAFLANNFGMAGSDFESSVPDDFSSEPDNFLPNVTDPAIRQWALAVNDLWQDLCCEVTNLKVPHLIACISPVCKFIRQVRQTGHLGHRRPIARLLTGGW